MTSLRQYYQIVGFALTENLKDQRVFQERVAFVPTEILESYLDDLLSPGIRNETLFIDKNSSQLKNFACILAFLIGLVCLGLIALKAVGPLFFSGILILGITSIFTGMVIFSVTKGIFQRMSFSRTVHAEIRRRRGTGTTITFRDDLFEAPSNRIAMVH